MNESIASGVARGGYLIVILAVAIGLGSVELHNDVQMGFVKPFWLGVLQQQSSANGLSYVVLPIWLIVAGYQIPGDRVDMLVVRAGSHSRVFWLWLLRFALPHAAIISILLFLAACSVASALPHGGYGQVSQTLPATTLWWWHAWSPWWIVLLNALQSTFLCVTYAAILYLVTYRRRAIVKVCVVVGMLLGSFVLMRSPVIAFFSATHPTSFSPTGLPVLDSILVVCALATIPVSLTMLWRIIEYHSWGQSLSLTYTLGGVTAVGVLGAFAAFHSGDLEHVVRMVFFGGSSGSMYLLSFGLYVLLFLGVGTWITLRVAHASHPVLTYIAIRSGNLSRWYLSAVRRIVILALLTMVTVLLIVVISAVLFGRAAVTPASLRVTAAILILGLCQLVIVATASLGTVLGKPDVRVVVIGWALAVLCSLPVIGQNGMSPLGLPLIGSLEVEAVMGRVLAGIVWVLVVFLAGWLAMRTRTGQRFVMSRSGA